ncbi:hypothetical protein GW17_00003356 [Ensete ventricosum]|nr:hypothetical protein GW17_00003356 [Ensete ventricosum]
MGQCIDPRLTSLSRSWSLLSNCLRWSSALMLFQWTKDCNFDLYRSYRVVRTGLPGYRYADCPLPSGMAKTTISIVDGRLREISNVGNRLREKKGRRRRRRGEEERSTSCHPRPCVVAARGLLACRCRPRPQAIFLPREETERLPARGERSR